MHIFGRAGREVRAPFAFSFVFFVKRYFVNVRHDTVAEAYRKYQEVCAKFLSKDFL